MVPVRNAVVGITGSHAYQGVRRFWRSKDPLPKAGVGGIKLIGSFAALLIGLQIVLRHNAPPRGVIFFGANALAIIIAVAVVVVGLTLFFRLTDVGIAVRASAENADRAVLLGISVRRLSTYVWMLAVALSALGVFLRIPVIGLPIGVDVGPFVLLYALAAAVIARMESFSVALAAAIGIGILEQSLYYF